MKIAGAVIAIILVALGIFVGAAATRPDTMHIERSVLIDATPADVYPFGNEFQRFMEWNPWRELDPNQVETFSEQGSGVDAWYAWEGDDKVGKGKMTIIASEPDARVSYDLEFLEPWQSTAVVNWTLTAEETQTRVTWGFDSDADLMSKIMDMVMDMDAMLGADFERGLTKLKPLAEEAKTRRLEAEAKAAEEAEKAAREAAEAAAAASDALGEALETQE